MKNKNIINWDALIELSSNEIDEENVFDSLHQSLSEDEKLLFREINKIKLENDSTDVLESKNEVLEKIYHGMFATQKSKGNKIKNKTLLFLLLAAACMGIILINTILSNMVSDELILTEFSSQKGTSKVKLSDGTVVILNSESKLLYPSNFDGDIRRVMLEGEAFFDVTTNDQPFVVSVNNVEIEVLGTSFNIKAYANDGEITTSLVSGKVKFREKHTNKSLLLLPSQSVIYNKETSETNLKEVDLDYITAWVEGKLIFKKKAFSSLCSDLEKKFNCTIEIKKQEVSQKIFTGKFVNDESLPEILEIIKINVSFRYTIENNKVTIF